MHRSLQLAHQKINAKYVTDHPKATVLHPKCIEHEKKGSTRSTEINQHVNHEFTDQMRVSNTWNKLYFSGKYRDI